ncbi:Ku domain-containing protein [Caenorhabditis elegans]|uniref:Ku domain-containing protein n=1 Tax=Caenorhabditis elegans TaxID=6239 RepID=Q9U2D2_CAEEL|nr:Ku domain-containing protein [Caenorhabditis elegans]CAB55094.3 Ku domain-containing protein [Caenorhabditis elegans]|eukprot:NP_499438.2 Caenorhabditis KU [Caenorhabditis elegans]
MDETRFEDDDFEGSTANKKYTFFIIDGNPAMFETSKAGEPPEFKLALKLILDEIVRVCCSRSLNNHIGVIVTSTKNSETEGLENSTLLVPMGVLGQEEVNKIKEIAEEENLLSAVNNYGGDHHKSDLSNVLNYCKRVFASCSNTRHQSVIYLTNNRNPFERDDFLESSHFKRTKAAVTKIIGEGHRKTLGEFSVIMLPEDGYKPQDKDEKRKEPWYDLDTEVFSTECDAAARIRQKITAQRSHATLTVNVGPGVTFDVSVFSMVMEAKPLDHSQKYTRDTEEKIVKTSGYVKKESKMELESTEIETQDSVLDETQKMLIRCKFLEDSIRNRRDLKKSIEIGGEKIILDGDQYEYMNEVNSKGVDFVGFCSMSRVDRETSVVSSKIIQPNDQTTLGSTAIYRTFLDRCWARQQAIVCKYQSRSKQKMRLMALVPFKKDMTLIEKRHENGEDDDDMEDKKPDLLRLEQQRAQADSSEWLHEGFMLVGQPFREELRDDFKRFEEQQNVLTEPSTEEQVNTMKQFVKRLTMSYNPSFYENPRLLSERSALCLEATGEELIERRDTLEPYYQIPKRLQRVGTEIEKIVETFALNDEIKETKPKASAGRKRKTDDDEPSTSKKATMTIRDCIAADKIGKFKKDELLSMAVEHCEASKSLKSKTKNDIIAVIEAYLDENPSATWNI